MVETCRIVCFAAELREYLYIYITESACINSVCKLNWRHETINVINNYCLLSKSTHKSQITSIQRHTHIYVYTRGQCTTKTSLMIRFSSISMELAECTQCLSHSGQRRQVNAVRALLRTGIEENRRKK